MNEISRSGACLQMNGPMPLKTPVRITYAGGELTGKVRYSQEWQDGYRIGLEFDPGCHWSRRKPQPLSAMS
jgi:hypothetical protein